MKVCDCGHAGHPPSGTLFAIEARMAGERGRGIVAKVQREQFSAARTDERAAEAVEHEVKNPETLKSLQRAHAQLGRGEGRNWREIYPPK